MNRLAPTRAERLFRREAREIEPTLVEKVAGTIGTSGPGKHRNRIDDRAQIALARPYCVFGPLPIVNIRQQHVPAGNSTGCVAHGKGPHLEPSINAIRPAATVFDVIGSSCCDRMRKGRDHPGKVIRMNRVAVRPALQLFRRLAKVLQNLRVKTVNLARGTHGTHQSRNAVQDQLRVQFVFQQRLFRTMPFGDLFPQFVVDRGKFRSSLRNPSIQIPGDTLLFQSAARFV
jgi:hypothetical protein